MSLEENDRGEIKTRLPQPRARRSSLGPLGYAVRPLVALSRLRCSEPPSPSNHRYTPSTPQLTQPTQQTLHLNFPAHFPSVRWPHRPQSHLTEASQEATSDPLGGYLVPSISTFGSQPHHSSAGTSAMTVGMWLPPAQLLASGSQLGGEESALVFVVGKVGVMRRLSANACRWRRCWSHRHTQKGSRQVDSGAVDGTKSRPNSDHACGVRVHREGKEMAARRKRSKYVQPHQVVFSASPCQLLLQIFETIQWRDG